MSERQETQAATSEPVAKAALKLLNAAEGLCRVYGKLSASMRIGSERRVLWEAMFDAKNYFKEVLAAPAAAHPAPSDELIATLRQQLANANETIAQMRGNRFSGRAALSAQQAGVQEAPRDERLWTVWHNGKSASADTMTGCFAAARKLRTPEEQATAAANLAAAIRTDEAENADVDAKDAQRYRKIKADNAASRDETFCLFWDKDGNLLPVASKDMDAEIDAALASQGVKGGE